MTISTTKNRIEHVGDGIQTVFPYDFKVILASHMSVFIDNVLTPSGWTIDGLGDPTGGNVTFAVAPDVDAEIVLLRLVPFTQLIDYVPYDPFPAETHETALDLLTMITQQLDEVDGRSLHYDIGTSMTLAQAVVPDVIPERALASDASGNLVWSDVGLGTGAPVVNPLNSSLETGGFAIVGTDANTGGNITFVADGATGIIDATEFARQGQDLDERYAIDVLAPETKPQVRLPGTWVDLPESATVTVSETPPSSPVNGDLWLQSSTGRLAAWYDDGSSQQWVECGPGAVGTDPREVLLFDVDLAGLSEYAWELEAGYDYRYDLSEFTFAAETWGALQVSKDALPSPVWQGSDWTWVYDGGLGSGASNNATANAPLNISGVNIGTNTNERAYCWGHIRNADNGAAYRTFVNHKTRARLQNAGAPGSLQTLEWSAWNQIAGPHVAARVSPAIATTFSEGRIRIWRERRGF